MVIVLVIDSIFASNNGTSISSRRFAEALAAKGHTVRVVTYGDSDHDGFDPKTGFHLYHVPELIVPVVTRLAHLQKDLWAKPVRSTLERAFSGADIVHIYNPFPLGRAAQKIAKQMDIPTLGAFHCQPENITYNIGLGWFTPAAHLVYIVLNGLFYRHFSDIHCPSKFIAVQLRKHGYRQWLHVLSNGVHPDFKPPESRPATSGEHIKILMVGRLSPEKRQDVLIHAATLSRHARKIQLIFAGCGPKEKKLKELAKKLPNPPRFCFLSQPDLIQLMQACDLYVHASDVEIEGISCLEAISCGLVPVISNSKKSASAQFALFNENVFKSGDPVDLARKIDYWIDHPETKREAQKAYEQFVPKYALEHSIRRIEVVYASIIRQKNQYNPYTSGRLFRSLSRLFYVGLAIPLLYLWSRVILGTRIEGARNLRGLKGSLTICNHVHSLDSVLVALAAFPRKLVFPTLPSNLNTLWPGKVIRLLGGVAISDKPNQLRIFMDEMEYQLRMGRVIHFFPEGELAAYDSSLRPFKNGAFHLAAQADVPIVPMTITFKPTSGLRRLFHHRLVMKLIVGKPIYPKTYDDRADAELRQQEALNSMRTMMQTRHTG